MMISTCGTCGRIFPGGDQELQNHIAVTGHQSTFYSCFSCDYRFASQYYAKQHMDAEDHWIPTSPPLSCSKCTSRFSNEEDAEKHEHKIHLRCRPCNVSFPTSQELSMHLRGRMHKDFSMYCPFCNRSKLSAGGLISHLESGSCPDSKLDSDTLYEAVLQRDPNGVLSKQLQDWTGTPRFEVTADTWNSKAQAYECRICHRLFKQLPDLQFHVNSAAHTKKIYHCPNPRCRKAFNHLGSTIHHLELETCQFMSFEAVQKNVEEALKFYYMFQD
ncbi:hypothetical protein CGCF413_v006431 [Colletotrichum fructicola]|nr:hypothetical protein CGCF413_v006431 [Colletotrichum fructicola]